MDEKSNVALVILAAGNSSRMKKQVKQLLPWRDTTLLGHTIAVACQTKAANVYVVLGAHSDEIKAKVPLNAVTVIQNMNWIDGLGSSIAAAITFFKMNNKAYDATMIMLADQPFVNGEHLNRLIDAFEQGTAGIVTTKYKSNTGVPAVFDACYHDELAQLNTDFGAKEIIAKYSNQVVGLKASTPSLVDIDTWNDYTKLTEVVLKNKTP